MAGIDPRKLKNFQKDLEEKSKGVDNFINASKIDGTIDFRILEPLANMDGLYSLELSVWWVNKKKIIVPDIFGERDIIQEVISAAEGQDDPDIKKLLNAKNDFGSLKVRKQIEYWIPGLVLDWKIDDKDQIVGIHNEAGEIDVNLVDLFVRGKGPKILNCKIQLMKDINKEATTRGGYIMFDQVKGFNLILEKSGSGRDTLYTASRADYMPMPAKYYGEGNTPDVINICKAALYSDEYMDAVIGNYLYGEEIPEDSDDNYRYPEVRAALKKASKQTEAAKQAEVAKSKGPGRPGTTTADPTPNQEPAQGIAPEAQTDEQESEAAPAATRPGRPATKGDTPKGPKRGGAKTGPKRSPGSGRNVADDLNEVDDE